MDEKLYILSTSYTLRNRTTKKGNVYDVVFRVYDYAGNEAQKRLCGFTTKTLAKQGYFEFIKKNCELLENNILNLNKDTDLKKENLYFNALVTKYFSSIANQIKDATIYEEQKIFNLWILPYFNDIKIKNLTKSKLLLWQDDLWKKRNPKTGNFYSYKYLSKIRAYFSSFLTWCSERYPNEVHNYLMEIKKPKRRTSQKEMLFWTREEFEKFISCVNNQLYHTIFMMLFFTGRRKGEILALSPNDIYLKKGYISFNKSITRKTTDGSPYKITSTKTELISKTYLCTPLLNELKKYIPQENAKFYFGGDEPISDNTLRRQFNYYCEKANVKQIRIHDLRHSFVSMCIHKGATLPAVADLIGDTLAQVTKTYAHLYDDDKKNIIKNLE